MTQQKYILITIDTEFYGGLEEVLGLNGRYGIDDMLSLFAKHNVKATFFVDYFGVYKWGNEIFQEVTNKIKSAGHEVELHLHPSIKGGKNWLWQYSEEEQEKYISDGITLFEQFNHSQPKYFRAGGYGINNTTLKVLKKLEFEADFSYQYQQKRCKLINYPYKNKAAMVEGLIQIPTTMYRLKSKPVKQSNINLDWSSLWELKSILNEIIKSNFNSMILIVHSFSFLHRWNRKKFFSAPEKIKRLEKFIIHGKKNGFNFVTASEYFRNGGFDANCKGEDFVPEVGNIFAIITGFAISLINHFIIKKKIRYLIILFCIIFIGVGFILWNLY
jgi:peptidoglycan/xylan/chitin deacetylase (PgdA/CDA1 family)